MAYDEKEAIAVEMTLAENIRSLRKQRGLTQEQLAEVTGVSAGAVYKWEAGLSVPELSLLVELAEFFDCSVDALLGYRLRRSTPEAAVERLSAFMRRGDRAGIGEAERLLKKYPNSFELTYKCAVLFEAFGAQDRDGALLRRALELFERARALIAGNGDPRISEHTIGMEMGGIHILLGEPEKGLELLRRHNGGRSDCASIGSCLAVFLHRPEEAEPYLQEGLLCAASDLMNAVLGYAFLFAGRGDWTAEREIVSLGLSLLRGLRREAAPGFLDKTEAGLLLPLSQALLGAGDRAGAAENLRRAAALTRRFDEDPVFGLDAFRFGVIPGGVTLYDVMGATAADGQARLLELIGDGELTELWREAYENA